MITFQYPAYNPTTSISLGSPEKGDTQVFNDEVFIHPTESGQYKSNVVVSCLGDFERSIVIAGMCKADKEAFLIFIRDGYGHYIKYTDYDGLMWVTQITNETINITNGPYGWDIELTLLVWELT